ncbi:MAG: hypothetical protein U1F43_19220 [Myxococcota bacterium]
MATTSAPGSDQAMAAAFQPVPQPSSSTRARAGAAVATPNARPMTAMRHGCVWAKA